MKIKTIIINILNNLVKKSYWYKNQVFLDCPKFWNYQTFNTDIVNLGSTSAVHAFDYSLINAKCANWAISKNSLSGDFAILQNYASYLNPQKSVAIFSLCPFSSLAGSYKHDDDRYYSLLYPGTIPSFSMNRLEHVRGMKNNPILYYPFFNFFTDIFRPLFNKNKLLTEYDFEQDAKKKFNAWKDEFSIIDLDKYHLSLVNKDAISDSLGILDKIINFCISHNITPVFVYPPLYHTLAEYFSEVVQNQIVLPLIDALEKRKVLVLNYMNDVQFLRNREFFQDSFLLNSKGANYFTSRVIKDIGINNN